MLARRLQLEQADAAAKAALADSMAARDEQQRTRDDLRSKLAEPSLNQAASLKEKIPTVETRKRVATTQLEQLEEEWARVDAEAKKKYQTVEKAIEDHLKVLAWCAHRLAHRAHTVASLSFGFFFPRREKGEIRLVAERVASIKERELQVVEKRLDLEQAQLDQE